MCIKDNYDMKAKLTTKSQPSISHANAIIENTYVFFNDMIRSFDLESGSIIEKRNLEDDNPFYSFLQSTA
jgi:hypothetical protein